MTDDRDDDIHLEGWFWLPEQESQRVRGNVQWVDRQPVLHLEAALRSPPEDENPLERIRSSALDEADVISGETLVGEPVCLKDCFVTGMDGKRVAHPQRWSAAEVLIGLTTPPPTVASVDVRLHGLADFYGHPTLGDLNPTTVGNRDRITVDWFSSPKVEVPFGDMTVIFDDDLEVHGPPNNLVLTSDPRIQITPPAPRPLEDLRPEVAILSTLVGLFRGAAAELDQLWLTAPDGTRVRCLERLRALPPHTGESHIWLGLGSLVPIEETLQRWREFCLRNENGITMISEYLRERPRTMTIDKLLVLARFMEDYSHNLLADGSMPKSKDNLEKKIRFLLVRHEAAVGPFMGKHNGEAFPKAVALTRHYHTHFNPEKAQQAATGLDLVQLIDRLWLLTRACVLHDLGFDDARSAALLADDPHVSALARHP